MEILGQQPGIKVRRSARIVTGGLETAMVRDVIEINANAETMGHLDDLQQLSFGAVPGSDGSPLVFVAEIKRVKQIVTDGKDAARFGRRRQP